MKAHRQKLANIAVTLTVVVGSGAALVAHDSYEAKLKVACTHFIHAINYDEDSQQFAASLKGVVSEAPATLKPHLNSLLKVAEDGQFPDSGLHDSAALRRQCVS